MLLVTVQPAAELQDALYRNAFNPIIIFFSNSRTAHVPATRSQTPQNSIGEENPLKLWNLIPCLQESEVPLKKILLWNGASSWNGLKPGRGVFLKVWFYEWLRTLNYELNSQEECPVSSCALVSSRSEAERADLVIFKDHFTMPTFDRPSYQKWMLYLLGELNHVLRGTITIITNPRLAQTYFIAECPLHTQMFKFPSVFNWTATYR